jgi:hypothetical protein
MEIALAAAGAVWMLLIPGLPVAAAVAGGGWSWWQVGAVAPAMSVGINYASLWLLNHLGVRPDLRLYGGVMTAVALTFTWKLLSSPRCPVMASRGRAIWFVGILAVPASISLALWWAALSGFAFVAPNSDGENHNFWISRIVNEGSVLQPDVRVASPLQSRVPDPDSVGFYTLAWHAGVATA